MKGGQATTMPKPANVGNLQPTSTEASATVAVPKDNRKILNSFLAAIEMEEVRDYESFRSLVEPAGPSPPVMITHRACKATTNLSKPILFREAA